MKIAIFVLTAVALPFFSAININFDSLKSGELPPGWTSTFNNHAAAAPFSWIVVHDPNAPSRPNVLAHSTAASAHAAPGDRVPLCLFDKVTCLDGDVSVKMKIISGKDGQDAGVVFRAGQSSYYLVRASARDHNLAMFRVWYGHFEPVQPKGARAGSFGVFHTIKTGDWNLLRVTYKGSQATVYFNHRKVFEASDSAFSTAGRVGVWTEGDTVAYFDDFRIDKKK